MKFALQIAVLLALTSLPAAAGVEDAQAHTKLTDGVRATTDPADAAWLAIYSDSTQLPVSTFRPMSSASGGSTPRRASVPNALLRYTVCSKTPTFAASATICRGTACSRNRRSTTMVRRRG